MPMCSPSLMLISTWRASSQHCRAMSSFSPNGAWSRASPRSKSKHVRPAPSSAWISPTKMPCMRPAGVVGGVLVRRCQACCVARSATGFCGRTPHPRSPCARTARRAPVRSPATFASCQLHLLDHSSPVASATAQLLTTTLPAEHRYHRIGRVDTGEKSGKTVVDEEVRTAELVARIDDHARIRALQVGNCRSDADACVGLQAGRTDLRPEAGPYDVREEVTATRGDAALSLNCSSRSPQYTWRNSVPGQAPTDSGSTQPVSTVGAPMIAET